MAGQKNLKMLKLLGGAAALLIGTYILYSYRQTSNDVQLKTLHLKEAREENAALSRRFDMLSNELKGAVQVSANFDRQLRLEKKSHEQTTKEKQEVERQCRTEAVRLENEKAQVVKEKQQLIEDEDQVKRERDRISSRLETLTQECSDARESAHQQQFQCQEKLEQCQTRAGSMEGELNTCKSSLEVANGGAARCNSEVQALRGTNQECETSAASLRDQLRRMQSQQNQPSQQRGPSNLQQGFNNPQQGGPSNPQQGFNNPQQVDHLNNLQQRGVDVNDNPLHLNAPQQGQQANLNAPWRNSEERPAYQARDTNFQQQQQQHNSLVRRDLPAVGHEPSDGQEAGGDGHHKTVEEKRAIYRALRDKVKRGEALNSKQLQVYPLLSRQFEGEPVHPDVHQPRGGGGGGQEGGAPVPRLGVQEPAPRLLEDGDQEAEHPAPQLLEEEGQEVDGNRVGVVNPPVPGGIQQPPLPGGQNNNEQEEVKDLVEGGQQKAEVFENVKERQPEAVEEGGAGGPNNEDSDEGVELRGVERGGKPLDDVGGGDPLPKPVPNPLEHDDLAVQEKEGVVNEDDDDYGAVEVVDKRGNEYEDEGHRAFLNDQKMMYNEEKQRLMRRESLEKVPEEERDGHWRDQGGVAARREMR